MYYLIVDLEMGEVDPKDRVRFKGMAKEIIQLGAVMIGPRLTAEGEFSSYCKPRIAYVSHYIKKITGITAGTIKSAPPIETVLRDLSDWLGDREITAMSWSDADCRQLQREMEVKRIRLPRITRLFDGWADLQRDFGRLAGLKERVGLAEALQICHIKPVGREHDGLADARNTARLFAKCASAEHIPLTLTPFQAGGSQPPGLKQNTKLWAMERMVYAMRHGRDEANGDGFKKYYLEKRMRRA